MDGSDWLNTLSRFQAHIRGYLTRNEIKCACSEFEDIVRELDGDVGHLDWRGHSIIPRPHFKDTDGPLQKLDAFAKDVEKQADRGSCFTEQPGDTEEVQILSDRIEPERDGGSCSASSPPVVEGEQGSCQGKLLEGGGRLEGGLLASQEDATTVWSCPGLDTSYRQGSHQRRSLVQDVPLTPEVLKQHRNSLAMEMLWLRQAIDSRKKVRVFSHVRSLQANQQQYLSLKETLNMS
ncbi:hypothetical protein DPEC_G00317610 [Dallia pectoralis]|uniref:Uncharacterized protein n=1 Tax=Dallia pectoralis TaxID=75939 RepID=A0ACC2FD17_DALPE|nr:hypothetical protein DPEC_G00317610 [Dallia pectoralis]